MYSLSLKKNNKIQVVNGQNEKIDAYLQIIVLYVIIGSH